MEEDNREKPKFANEESGDDVEGHKFEPTDGEQEKSKFATEEREDVEGHKF